MTNRQIFTVLWTTQHLIRNKDDLYVLLLGLGISFSLPPDQKIPFFLITLGLWLLSAVVAYIIQCVALALKTRRMQKGFGWDAWLTSSMSGAIMLVVCLFASKFALQWFFPSMDMLIDGIRNGEGAPNHFPAMGDLLIHVLADAHRLVEQYGFWLFNGIATRFLFQRPEETDSFLFVLQILLLFTALLISYGLAGRWYRKLPSSYATAERGWIVWYGRLLERWTKNGLVRVQLRNLVRDSEQLSSDYSFFYLDFGVWMFVGFAMGATTVAMPDWAMILVFHFLVNGMARDAFYSIDSFPGKLKFDADGKASRLFRLSGQSYSQLYEAKIWTQRLLGIHIAVAGVILVTWILKGNLFFLLLAGGIVVLHFILTPHLATMPSYISPHFKRQHYTEGEEYQEQAWLDEGVFEKGRDWLTYLCLAPILVSIALEGIRVPIYVAASIAWLGIVLVVFYTITHYAKRKVTKMIDRSDIIS
ncbi:hypothetical protein [Salinithrix halophila]|uniref:ABC-2 type transport system permease protein n=1 Tax=Salinithrix halophila TaxID=1485204 RepID=A0ABV8JHF9_9BACL